MIGHTNTKEVTRERQQKRLRTGQLAQTGQVRKETQRQEKEVGCSRAGTAAYAS